MHTKRLALLLFGLSYTNYKHWSSGDVLIDFRLSIDNYKNYIYKYFNNKGYIIDVFIATNPIKDNNILTDLLLTYKPAKYEFVEDSPNIITSRNMKFNKVAELCSNYSKRYNIQYDHCLITRFDLEFKKDFNLCDFRMDNINITSVLELPTGICDNFYLFPFKYLDQIHKVGQKNINKYFHNIEQDLREISDIYFFCNEHVAIPQLSFYKIIRTITNNK